jgi:ribose 5-phosphate isomerase RpiB
VIYTARQLEQLHTTNGHVTLPYHARLTPAAQDWVRARRIAVEYTDGETAPESSPSREPGTGSVSARPQGGACSRCNAADSPALRAGAKQAHESTSKQEHHSTSRGAFLWWCDGPCGTAKAAILAHARDANLLPVEVGADPASTAAAVKHVALEVNSGRVTGAIFAVGHGAAAMVMANRCASLRAVLGTCLDSVDQAVRRVGANVLVLEHSHRTLMEMRNMIRRFTSAQVRDVAPDVERQLRELSACG